MAEIVKMPKMSDTMEEGVVAKWLKQVNELFKYYINELFPTDPQSTHLSGGSTTVGLLDGQVVLHGGHQVPAVPLQL